jgi:hypothetical protein
MQTTVPRLISLLLALHHVTHYIESTSQQVVYSDTQHSTSITEPIDPCCFNISYCNGHNLICSRQKLRMCRHMSRLRC